jgi:hypothetical protein
VSSRRPHEPEQLTVQVTRRPGGGFVLSCPLCPGWAVPARTPAELAQRMEQAWAEAAVAAYARLRGVLYDLADTEETIPPGAYPASPRSTRGRPRMRWPRRRRGSGTPPPTTRSGGWSCRTGGGCPPRGSGTGRRPGWRPRSGGRAAGDGRTLSAVIILGVVLLVVGIIVPTLSILIWVGIALIVVGAVLALLGTSGRGVGGRRHYY